MNSPSDSQTTQSPSYPIPGLPLYQPDLISIGIYGIAVLLLVGRWFGNNEWTFPLVSRLFFWVKSLNPFGNLEEEVALLRTRAAIHDNHLTKAVIITNSEGEVIWASDRALKLADIDSEGIKNNGWISTVHQDDRDRVLEEWERAKKEKIDLRVKYRYYSQRLDKTSWVETTAHISFTPKGKVAGWVALVWSTPPPGDCPSHMYQPPRL